MSERPDREETRMERYRNLGGDSGVVGFECGVDFVRVQFSDGAVYVYTSQSAGEANIECMVQLARDGAGLNSFINRVVRNRYASRS